MIPDPLIHALWLSAGAAAAWRITALHYRARLTAMTQSRDTYRAWWERDSARAIKAEAELDLIREQRRAAGRQSHKAERQLIAARTEELRRCVAARHKPLDGAGRGVLPTSSPAREGESLPAPLSHPAGAQRPGQRVRSGAQAPAQAVRSSAPLCRRGQPSSAETTMKGASHG